MPGDRIRLLDVPVEPARVTTMAKDSGKRDPQSRPFATVGKGFTFAGNLYKPGDRFPRHGEQPGMDWVRGAVAGQMIVLDRVPGPGDKLGQGQKNPNAIRREANANALTE
jgi:hypothetical protein